jgi:hypothetical protein
MASRRLRQVYVSSQPCWSTVLGVTPHFGLLAGPHLGDWALWFIIVELKPAQHIVLALRKIGGKNIFRPPICELRLPIN